VAKLPISYPTLVPKGNSVDELRLLMDSLTRALQQIAGVVNNPDWGTTSQRPTQQLVNGQTFFDTTIGKPIWWLGTVWVDATGTLA
jgi:hypothetical protein